MLFFSLHQHYSTQNRYICNQMKELNMNKEVIALIDISTPEGREIVRQLEKEKSVKIERPKTEEQKFYTHEEVWDHLEEKFNVHYGTDLKFEK